MNTSNPETKFGLTDLEVNNLTKLLFLATMSLSFVMVSIKVNIFIRFVRRFVFCYEQLRSEAKT